MHMHTHIHVTYRFLAQTQIKKVIVMMMIMKMMLMMMMMIGLTNFGSVEAAILYYFLLILCWETSEERFALLFLSFYFPCDVTVELSGPCVVSDPSVCVYCSHPACSFNEERDAHDIWTEQMTRGEQHSSPTLRHSPRLHRLRVCVCTLILFQCFKTTSLQLHQGKLYKVYKYVNI